MSTLSAPETTLPSTIGRIAAILGGAGLTSGDRAVLRRMTPDQPPPLTFYRLANGYLPDGWDRDRDTIRDWTVLVAGMAIMSPGAHLPEAGLGSTLAQSGYAEARLERLLAAEDDTRRTLLLRAARFMAAKSARCNWVDAARLLLTRDPEGREAIRRKIARDFYTRIER